MKDINKKKPKGQKRQTLDVLSHRSNKTLTLLLEGTLNINRAWELKKVIHDALEGADKIIVDLGNAYEFDISLLQILCSAHRSAAVKQKVFELSKNSPEELVQLAQGAGFLRARGCSHDTCGNCLWKKEPGKGVVVKEDT